MPGRINRLCYSLMFFIGIYLAIYQSSMTYITEGMANRGMATGILVGLHFLGIMAGPVTLGEIGDRVGKKQVLIAAFVLVLAGMGTVALSRSIPIIGLGIFLIGSGAGSIESLGSSILADENRRDTNRVLNMSQVFFSVGTVLGPFITLYIMEITKKWQYSYGVSFLLFFILLVMTLKTPFKGKDIKKKDKRGKPFWITALKDGYFRILCLLIFFYVGIEGSAAFWIITYFKDVLHDPSMGTYALSGFWVLMIIGRMLGSGIKKNMDKVVGLSLVFSMGAMFLSLLGATVPSALLGFSLLGLGYAVIWPALVAFASERFPENTGLTVGILMMFSAAGGIVIPFIIGAAADYGGIPRGLMLIPAILLIMLGLLFYGRKYTREKV